MKNKNGFLKSRKSRRDAVNKSYGPVKNLEAHVNPKWWREIFNPLYLKTDGDVVNDTLITRKEIDLLIEIMNLKPENIILDLCCGQGRHLIELAQRGFYKLNGLDRSNYLIQKAKKNSRKDNLNIQFKEGDARKLPYQQNFFDVILIMGNSFGYFETINDDLKVLREIYRILKPGGNIFIDLANGEYLISNFQDRSWEWIENKLFVCRERSLSTDNQRLVSREVITHTEKGVIADQFYAERLYTKESIKELLKKAGFINIDFPPHFIASSQRSQDLGMMEARFSISAKIDKKWTDNQSVQNDTKSIAVLLGDFKKPDIIKPKQVFDEDDFFTIEKMKEALSQISGYQFKFLYDHDNLMEQLIKEKNNIDFVLNLCDEGFMNDPTKELHIPAILEILNIPYTGSGPQCLAYCYDKSLIRGIAQEMSIPVAEAIFIKPEDMTFELPFLFPAIVKPNYGDSSFGITADSVVFNGEELLNAISKIRTEFGYDKPILVEKFLSGNDITVGIIGEIPTSYTVLPILEEDYSELQIDLPKVCGYEAKWCPDSPYFKVKSIPANLDETTKNNVIEWCVKLAERLSCQDYTRFDWRLDEDSKPHLLEVNPNPGWCWDGHLAKMAAINDISYHEMLEKILVTSSNRIMGNNNSC